MGGGGNLCYNITFYETQSENLNVYLTVGNSEASHTRSTKDRLLTSSNLQPNQKHLGQNVDFLNGVSLIYSLLRLCPNFAEHLRYISYELGHTPSMAPP